MLLYIGTRDERVLHEVAQQRAALDAAGIQVTVFEGLDHDQPVASAAAVLPVMRAFLGAQ